MLHYMFVMMLPRGLFITAAILQGVLHVVIRILPGVLHVVIRILPGVSFVTLHVFLMILPKLLYDTLGGNFD